MPSLRVDRLETGLIGPLSFEVAEGERVALMGASGAGKYVGGAVHGIRSGRT